MPKRKRLTDAGIARLPLEAREYTVATCRHPRDPLHLHPARSTPPSTVGLHNSGTVPVRRTAPPATSGHADFRDCPRRSLPLQRELLISRDSQ